ncbi:uncharacterized protein UBRO_06907 [Ustilago bromivora]|uniref:Zn(2)-C6 fungal-type domain-containing protein n=1 Tax=Ustilago bromivora TaxID=307758 RepID=A0A1K0H8I1_9BASI|nr:uncharacterized protein UBRO_06907 [Ustilago bromivora]
MPSSNTRPNSTARSISPSRSMASTSTIGANPNANADSSKNGKRGKDGKRKRVSRACDQCFLKKDRCDALEPLCTFCSRLDRRCTYDRPERKRGPIQGLRPRLEERIISLETVLGFMLAHSSSHINALQLKQCSGGERVHFREAWLQSKVRRQLESEFGLADGLAMHPTTTTMGKKQSSKQEEEEREEGEEEGEDSDYSQVDLSLPPTHHPCMHRTEEATWPNKLDEMLPELSSGQGGSSLNRSLVPRGTDANAALGGFEIQFGGNEQDEDWVRRFVPPKGKWRPGSEMCK